MTISMLLLLTVFILGVVLAQMYSEREKLRQELHRYQYLTSQEDFQSRLESEIRAQQNEVSRLIDERNQLSNDVSRLRQEVYVLYEEEYVQSFGFYQPRYDFISAGNYNVQLQRVKSLQRKMVRDNEAAICYQPLTLRRNESDSAKQIEKEGRKIVNNFLKLVLTTFNAECDDLIS